MMSLRRNNRFAELSCARQDRKHVSLRWLIWLCLAVLHRFRSTTRTTTSSATRHTKTNQAHEAHLRKPLKAAIQQRGKDMQRQCLGLGGGVGSEAPEDTNTSGSEAWASLLHAEPLSRVARNCCIN
jgi:hypothetical protein